jgi:hypothetical protein
MYRWCWKWRILFFFCGQTTYVVGHFKRYSERVLTFWPLICPGLGGMMATLFFTLIEHNTIFIYSTRRIYLLLSSSLPLGRGPSLGVPRFELGLALQQATVARNYLSYAASLCSLSTQKIISTIPQGPKKSRFPGSNHLPLALVIDLPASKALRTGPCISLVYK